MINYSGIYLLKVIRNCKIINNKILKNMITNDCLKEMIKPLYAQTPDLEIKYLAFGDGTGALDAEDHTLINEIYRISALTLENTDIGQVSSEFVLTKPETLSNTVTEIGIFAGSLATATLGTGLMISRLLLTTPITKIVDDEWYFQRLDVLKNG
jgi:hypothetical protein